MLSNRYLQITLGLLAVLLLALWQVDRPVKVEQRIEQRLEETGKGPPTHWLVPVWSWKALAANTALAGILVGLTPLAGRSLKQRPRHDTPMLRRRDRGLIAAACVLFLFQGIPRLDHSLWGDEEYTMRKLIVPQTELQEDGSVTLTPTPWTETLWEFQRPTNHLGYTWIARLFHDLGFEATAGATDPWFSERLIRLPVLMAGLGSIFALIWCCRCWGWSRGLGWIALAYAGHAWLTRFGVDARGYGFVLLLVPLLLGLLGRASQTGAWRYWIGFGFCQFYLLWTHLGSLLLVAALNLAALALLWFDDPRRRWAGLGRWAAVNVASAMLFLQLFAPCLPEFLAFLEKGELQGRIDGGWLMDAAASLYAGIPWHSWDPSNPLATAIWQQPLPGWVGSLAMALGAAAAVLGLIQLIRNKQGALLILFLGGPALMLLQLIRSETRPYYWYLIVFLPLLFLLWAAALQPTSSQKELPMMKRPTVWIALLALLGVHLSSFTRNRRLAEFPIEACRESVAVTRSITNPRHPDYGSDAITASPGMFTEGYDPATRRVDSNAALDALITDAETRDLPFFLNFGFPTLIADAHPGIVERLQQGKEFELVQRFDGQFHASTREVYRYTGSGR